MKQWWILALAAVVASSGLAPSVARAQFPLGQYTPPQVQARPPLSPWLNLNRAGAPPGVNYGTLVQPQFQTAQQLRSLQNQQTLLANELGGNMITPGQPAPTSMTGHPVYYLDYARYFPTNGLPLGSGYGGGAGMAGTGFNRPGYGSGIGSGSGYGAGGGATFGIIR
jgi:hypothetical protein